MPWLVRDGKVLATLEVATSIRDRTRGLLGRDGIDGAILLRPAKSVHTLRMRFPIDVAFCDRDLRVLKVVTVPRNRATLPVMKAHAVIESEAGTMARWGVQAGDTLDIRGLDDDEPTAGNGDAGTGADGVDVAAGDAIDTVIDVRDGAGGARRPRRAGHEPGRDGDDLSGPGRSPAADVVDGDGGRG